MDHKLKEVVSISDYQFELCEGKSTTEALYIRAYLEKNFTTFIDIAKVFYRVPRSALEKLR